MASYKYDAWGKWINKDTASNGTTLGDTLVKFPVLYFEDKISHRDSVKYYHLNANTLIRKLHLLYPDFDVYQWEGVLKGEAYIFKTRK